MERKARAGDTLLGHGSDSEEEDEESDDEEDEASEGDDETEEAPDRHFHHRFGLSLCGSRALLVDNFEYGTPD